MIRLPGVMGLLGLVLLADGCGESWEARRQREEAAEKARTEQRQERRKKLISELAARHEADESWSKNASGWTVEVQERLLRGRPIAGVAKFNDAEREGDVYRVHLDHGAILGPVIRFVLTCTRPELPRTRRSLLLGEDLFFGPEYVFVARIRRVSRSDFIEGDERSVRTRRRWIAEGDCLALQPVPSEASSQPGEKTRGRLEPRE